MNKDTLTVIPPAHALTGRRVMPPGSKSITNRALLLAGLAKGTSRLTGALKSDDTLYMAEALRGDGRHVEEPDATTFVVTSSGNFNPPEKPLFLGNAGTATRFSRAAVAMFNGRFVVDGDEHMRKRPIAPLVASLASLGRQIEAPTGCPPVTVDAKGGFTANRVVIDAGLSSQYVSALLMAPPAGVSLSRSSLRVRPSARRLYHADHRLHDRLRRRCARGGQCPLGHRADRLPRRRLSHRARRLGRHLSLGRGSADKGKSTSASPRPNFHQPDARSYDMIAAFPHMPAEIDGSQMQDAIPTLAVLAAYNETPVRFTGIENLRVKECDRIRALSLGLNNIRAGLAREEGDDLIVTRRSGTRGQTVSALIDTFADHRIAMSFALAGLKTSGIAIENPSCVAKTYPNYWDALGSLGVTFERKAG